MPKDIVPSFQSEQFSCSQKLSISIVTKLVPQLIGAAVKRKKPRHAGVSRPPSVHDEDDDGGGDDGDDVDDEDNDDGDGVPKF